MWGSRTQALGAGKVLTPLASLSVGELSEALRDVTSQCNTSGQGAMQIEAQKVAKGIATQNACKDLTKVLEDVVSNHKNHKRD